MLTLFSVPKPFEGEMGALQRRSVESWRALGVQVLLLGDVAEAARELDVEHVPGLESTAHGTPRLDSAFALADGAARFPLRCFVNADVVFGPDLLEAVEAVSGQEERFLLVGQTEEEGKRRGAAAMDWFVFPAGLFGEVPPFAVGRAGFDNWLVWKARQVGIVVDATHDVRAVHQPHGYEHVTAAWTRRTTARRRRGTSSSPAARAASTRSTTRATSSATGSSGATSARRCAGARTSASSPGRSGLR